MAVSIKRLRRGHSILRVKRIITVTVLATAITGASSAGIASADTNASETVGATTRNSFVPYAVTVTEGQAVRFFDGSFGGTHELRIGDELVVPPSSGSGCHSNVSHRRNIHLLLLAARHSGRRHARHGHGDAGRTPADDPDEHNADSSTDAATASADDGRQGDTTSAPAASRRTRHPRIVYRVEHWWAWNNRGTTPTQLSLSLNRPRTTVRVSCRGRGCPFRARTRVIRQRRVDLAPWFKGRPWRRARGIESCWSSGDTSGNRWSFACDARPCRA